MRWAGAIGICTILEIRSNDPGIRLISEGPDDVHTEHEGTAVQIFPSVGKIERGRQGQVIRDMCVGVIELFRESVSAKIFVNPRTRTSFVGHGVLVERSFKVYKRIGDRGIENKV